MDIADQADRQNEIMLAMHLQHAHRETPHAQPAGYCLFCKQPVEPPRRWCSPECRDDWQQENE